MGSQVNPSSGGISIPIAPQSTSNYPIQSYQVGSSASVSDVGVGGRIGVRIGGEGRGDRIGDGDFGHQHWNGFGDRGFGFGDRGFDDRRHWGGRFVPGHGFGFGGRLGGGFGGGCVGCPAVFQRCFCPIGYFCQYIPRTCFSCARSYCVSSF